MFKLDDNLLQELGLGTLPAVEKNKMLSHIYETLEMRVGMKLAEQMSNEQLDDFERFIDGDIAYARASLDQMKPGWETSQEYQTQLQTAQAAATREGRQFNPNAVTSEFGALSWLETNFPNYKQVVADELERLKLEVKAAAPQIVAASLADQQANGMQPGQQPGMPTTQAQQPPQYPQPQPYQPQQPQYPQQPMSQQPQQGNAPQPQPQPQQPVYQAPAVDPNQPQPPANPAQ